ncbi:protein-lysine methyltransferase METTL21D-like [Sitophilus oryzae]|uniref:Protein-lysine methyltransferase METTL21D-like n=1 Tax=Sitophilus oryzae TaxID=7048 RepID=A0A6J2X4V4_SITOR|nr:protein-lysine methyltransferase METTL21D-like [Sitophilus oryzae]
MSHSYFTRNIDIEALNITLKLQQQTEGDVGCVVWDASIVLSKYLEELFKKDNEYFNNTLAIELGAGVGCVGLTAACLGANVLLTDLPPIIPLLETNLLLNNQLFKREDTRVKVASLPWGSTNITHKPDVILLADCIYYRDSIDPLIETLRSLSGPQTTIILSQEIRESEKQKACWKYFLENVQKHFKSYVVPLEEQNDEFRSPDIVVIKFTSL